MKTDPFTEQFARWASWRHVHLYRLWGGMTPLNRNTLILTTRGRKTGRQISKPLLFYKQDDRIFIVASYGGSDRPPAWYLNLVANPEVRVEFGWSRGTYRAQTLSSEERAQVWPRLIATYPMYADYQRRTSREIPLVELTSVAR
jgi:F420H(2)-dependent quinone reductase